MGVGQRRLKRLGLVLFVLLGLALSPLIWDRAIQWQYSKKIIPIAQVKPDRVAIVFGARIYPDGRLSSMLRDRVDVGIQLYQAGLVDFNNVLDAQRSLLILQDELNQSNGAVISNLIRLYKALGGGWETLSNLG